MFVVDLDSSYPLLFRVDGTQRNVTLSASTVHPDSDITDLNIHVTEHAQWEDVFQTYRNDYEWIQVHPDGLTLSVQQALSTSVVRKL